ncbi:MAG: class I SAM-dependent methyltransferase [Candidatus Omnitrophica bacterium]|nr:class I SAM-dependent methyltransferase [Candidatus Omnitrophota bacterium]
MKKLLLKFILRLHTLIYSIIGKLSVLCNKGVHPKHGLLRYYEFFLDNINEKDIVLDVGCGSGVVAEALAKKAKHITAVDMKEASVRKASFLSRSSNIEYLSADVTQYAFRRRFDVVMLSNVLEHISRRVEFLKKMAKISDKILVRVPMVDRDWLTLYKKQLGMEYRLDKTHFIEYTLDSFKEEAGLAGLAVLNHYVRFGELYAVLAKTGL